MPTPNQRPSLKTDLATRYTTQHAGGTFDVKKVLEQPGKTPPSGEVIDASSMNGVNFQSPNGFEVKVTQGNTQMKDAQGTTSKELSTYVKGLDTRPYKK